jgi:hypothetical protein
VWIPQVEKHLNLRFIYAKVSLQEELHLPIQFSPHSERIFTPKPTSQVQRIKQHNKKTCEHLSKTSQEAVVLADNAVAKKIVGIEDIRQEKTGGDRKRNGTNVAEAGRALVVAWRH